MDYGLIGAELINKRLVSVLYYGESSDINDVKFQLEVNGKTSKLEIARFNRSDKLFRLELNSEVEILLGNINIIKTNDGESRPLSYETYVTTDEFAELYTDTKTEFGAFYSKEETTFVLWSPLSEKVFLKLEKTENNFVLLPLKRKDKGVYKITVKGDLFNKRYNYVIYQNNVVKEIRDPYGKGTSLNSKYSAVVDLGSLDIINKAKPTNEINHPTDSVIYELHIRDFTEIDKTNDQPGTYLGLLNKVDYLKKLGITHVQLLPVHDYFGVDDVAKDHYNWGYNPTSYFSLEGSYSSYPEDPLARLLEFKKLVAELHKNNIRVVMDVVYNHIYEFQNSDFHKNVPNYYFRRLGKKVSDGSGCGNDIATERVMVRKHILDSVSYLFDTFDIDGFRFDLLGLIDLDTSKEIVKLVKAKKSDALLYGEGWDMMTGLPKERKTCSDNAHQIPEMGFFNDKFRDVIKGSTFNRYDSGFISGNISNTDAIDDVLCASLLHNRYELISQSINYVECHDNQTLFDKLTYFSDNEDINLQRVKFANAITVLSLGVPFIHMGQEIGLSKCLLDNTYNVPKVNNMDWDLVASRSEMVDYLSDLIALRKQLGLYKVEHLSELENVSIKHLENGLITIEIKDNKLLFDDYKEGIIVINPTDSSQTLELKDYYLVYFGYDAINKEELYSKNFISKGLEVELLLLK